MLGEDEDWLCDVATEMDQEDGLIWVYGPGDTSVMAFTDFGVETLAGLVEIYKGQTRSTLASTRSETTGRHVRGILNEQARTRGQWLVGYGLCLINLSATRALSPASFAASVAVHGYRTGPVHAFRAPQSA